MTCGRGSGGAMGEAMGMAWQDVIGYHTTYPYHFSFQRYYATCFNVYPILNVPEKAIESYDPGK